MELDVTVQTMARLVQDEDGPQTLADEAQHGSDHEWDNNSVMICRECRFRAIAEETGCTRGTIGQNSMFGWHVQNGNGPADFCSFTPPEISEGETLRIEGKEWAVYSAA